MPEHFGGQKDADLADIWSWQITRHSMTPCLLPANSSLRIPWLMGSCLSHPQVQKPLDGTGV